MLMLFATVALVHLVALMSPGPDFFFVSQTAASRSRKEAMMGVFGITLGIVIWAGVRPDGPASDSAENGVAAPNYYGWRRYLSVMDGLAVNVFGTSAP